MVLSLNMVLIIPLTFHRECDASIEICSPWSVFQPFPTEHHHLGDAAVLLLNVFCLFTAMARKVFCVEM